jgi:branched-chain amino acid transport system ATP-binding protein
VVSRLGLSHVPEGRRLSGNLTVLENLQLATFARRDKEQIERDVEQVFSIFERLRERSSQKAGTLSGGEQQMLDIGRAFMSGRQFMILDEPSMGLALQFASRGYVLESGELVLQGESQGLLEDPEVKKAYLGG